MSYGAEQMVEKGNQSRHGRKGKYGRFQKKSRHRYMRQRLKNPDFVPQYNRYQAGWFD